MKHKKLLTNLLFAAVVLAIAAVLLLVRSAHSSGSKLRAELIYGDNNNTMNLPLDKNDTYDVDTGYYTVHIEIKDGAARFVDSQAAFGLARSPFRQSLRLCHLLQGNG